MQINIDPRVVKGIAAVVIVDQVFITGIMNRRRCNRNAALAQKFEAIASEAVAELDSMTARVDYLFDVLNKHEVPVDEFDLIALNNL